MMIISLLNQKGGVGKTTLAVNLAMGLSERDNRVMLIDADPQGSSLTWSGNREGEAPFPVVGIPKPTLHKELPKLVNNYDFIIVDGPPRVYDVTRSAILASDLILIPVTPSPYDVWATEETVKVIQEVKPFKESLKSFFVINRKIMNTVIGRDVIDALANYDIPVMQSQLCQRVGFAETAGEGKTVLETAPESQASDEIRALIQEILEALKQ
jgi:chromosome partitioning protein